MFELEQIRLGLSGYDEKLEEMGGSLDVAGARDKIAELEELSADPEFWNDLEKSQKTLQQLKALKNKVGKFESLETTYEDILTLIEMGIEEQDESIYDASVEEDVAREGVLYNPHFLLEKINFEGNTQISDEELTKLGLEVLGEDIFFDELLEVCSKVTNL